MFLRSRNARVEGRITSDKSKGFLAAILALNGLALAACLADSVQLNRDFPRGRPPLAPATSPPPSHVLRQEASQLFFLDERQGWVVSNGGLYGTTDGGEHWKILLRTDPRHTVEVMFATEHEGWAIINQTSGRHEHLVLRTDNGGHTWRRLLSLESPIYTINFVDNQTGFVRDRWDYLRQTSDRGNTWTELAFPEGEQHLSFFEGLQYFFFITKKEGWGYGSCIWHTTDGAKKWTEVIPSEKINGTLRSAAFVDDGHGWIVGSGREIWRMTDGSSWQPATNVPPAEGPPEQITRRLPGDLYCVSFVNTKDGWVAANDKTVLHSSDGGESWEIIFRWSSNIRALRFLSKTQGWAIDEDGRMLHTIDGGRSWNVQRLD